MKSLRRPFIQHLIGWWQSNPWRADVALAMIILMIEVLATYLVGQRQADRRALDGLGLALLTASAAALVFRRRYPGWVLIVANCLTLIYLLLDFPKGPNFLTTVVAFLTAVLHGRRLMAWCVLLGEFVLFPWLPYFAGIEAAPTSSSIVELAGRLLVLAIVAELAYLRQDRIARGREEASRRRAEEERLRIAHELHDVLGHDISLISVQAGVALHLMDQQPGQARIALTVIRDTSREALRELRSVLDVLRHTNEGAPRAPSPGLAHLTELVSRASAAGLHVETQVSGDLTRVPAHVDLTAYRIIQEALTNVMRHSDQTTSRISVACNAQELTLQIDNAMGSNLYRDRMEPGQGIIGMKERVSAVGGVVEAGPVGDGTFRVYARLPLEGKPLTEPPEVGR